MSGDGMSSLGLTAPLILLFLAILFMGFVATGLFFSGAAIVVRLRPDSEATSGKTPPQIYASIAVLAVSALLPILAGFLSHYGAYRAEIMLTAIGPFLLWPISVMLAIRGRGAGRRILLVGHRLIALWVAFIGITTLIYFLW
jgi:hypothetical protein